MSVAIAEKLAPKPESSPLTGVRLADHFAQFRKGIIGDDARVNGPFGSHPLLYADWTASGRLHWDIEQGMQRIGELYGNSHSGNSAVGASMTRGYQLAHDVIRNHVHAGPDDVALFKGNGMTGAMSWFQEMLDVAHRKPVVLVTHMEHHSNHTSWIHAGAEVVIVPQRNGLPDLQQLDALCRRYREANPDRPLYGSFTACSNVTGIRTDYHAMAEVMHRYGAPCFVDFSASAPYTAIDMHPGDPGRRLDAVFFSPHKFLGGPGSAGVVVFSKHLYARERPVHVGGGVVNWTNPWGGFGLIEGLPEREDPGTPGMLQAIRAAAAVRLQERMGPVAIHAAKNVLLARAFDNLDAVPGIVVFAGNHRDREAIISLTVDGVPHGLVTRLLNDRFGIQARAGCSCAGTYGHELFGIDTKESARITDAIDRGDFSSKPGWTRISLHPTMTVAEVDRITEALAEVAKHGSVWSREYRYDPATDAWSHPRDVTVARSFSEWFEPAPKLG